MVLEVSTCPAGSGRMTAGEQRSRPPDAVAVPGGRGGSGPRRAGPREPLPAKMASAVRHKSYPRRGKSQVMTSNASEGRCVRRGRMRSTHSGRSCGSRGGGTNVAGLGRAAVRARVTTCSNVTYAGADGPTVEYTFTGTGIEFVGRPRISLAVMCTSMVFWSDQSTGGSRLSPVRQREVHQEEGRRTSPPLELVDVIRIGPRHLLSRC